MRNSYCYNLSSLVEFWETLYADSDPRWMEWLTRNVCNSIDRICDLDLSTVRMSSAFGRTSTINSTLFGTYGINVQLALLPRDALASPIRDGVHIIDPYKLNDVDRNHYSMGGVLLALAPIGVEHRSKMEHLRDALVAVHGKLSSWSRISVEDAVRTAEKWVQMLNKQKLESGGTVSKVWSTTRYQALPVSNTEPLTSDSKLETIKTDFEIVSLDDEWAFKSEGRLMSHCVASYWPRISADPSSKILSLRDAVTGERYVTVEVKGQKILQEQAKGNTTPDDLCRIVLDRFYSERGLTREVNFIAPFNMANAIQANNIQANYAVHTPLYRNHFHLPTSIHYGSIREISFEQSLEGPGGHVLVTVQGWISIEHARQLANR